MIERSINLNPQQDGHKYLNFAEMHESFEAVQLYRKGISILKLDHERYTLTSNTQQAQLAVK